MKSLMLFILIIISITGCSNKFTYSSLPLKFSKKIWNDKSAQNFLKKCNIKYKIDLVNIYCPNKNITNQDIKYVRFDLMDNLKSVDLSDNKLTDIPFYLAQNPTVKYVNLSNNNIEYPFFNLKDMESLDTIDYSNNNMKIFNSDIYTNIGHKINVNLSNNNIRFLNSELKQINIIDN